MVCALLPVYGMSRWAYANRCKAPATFNVKLFDEHINTNTSFTPPGTLLTTLPGPGVANKMAIEIYSGPASNPAISQLLTRTQILSPLLIDGGTVIPFTEFTDDRWTAYFLYSKTPEGTYTFIGFTTVYLCYPVIPGVTEKKENKPDDSTYEEVCGAKKLLFCRARISQFVILPQIQKLGLGAQFYSSITSSLRADPAVFEITVEDPNEPFDDLRDLNDLAYLSTIPEFRELSINSDVKIVKSGRVPYSHIVDTAKAEEIRKAAKLAPGQFTKVLELYLLSTISPAVRWDPKVQLDYTSASKPIKSQGERKAEANEKKKYRLWLLMVKQRLYKHNRDVLIQLDRRERIEKLAETALNVEANLFKLLRKFVVGPGRHEFGEADSDVEESTFGSSESGEKKAMGGVKKISIDDGVASPSKKRAAEDGAEDREAKKAKS